MNKSCSDFFDEDMPLSQKSGCSFVGETPNNSHGSEVDVVEGNTPSNVSVGGFFRAIQAKRSVGVNCIASASVRHSNVLKEKNILSPIAAAGRDNAAPRTPSAASGIANVNDNKKQRSRKRGHLYFITLSLDFEPFKKIRERFVYNIVDGFKNVTTYCVAVERSSVGSSVPYHLHAFIELSDLCFVEEFGEFLRDIYDSYRVDIQPCRSRKSCLKYISKEDLQLYFNCKVSELHINYRLHEWASRVSSFKYTDPFVVEHRHQHNFLKKYFEDHKKINVKEFQGYDIYVGDIYDGWHNAVCAWYNEWMKILKDKRKVVKRKQLFLYGPSNVGKTSVVERLIGKVNMKFVFYPGVGQFFMQGFDPAYHKFIIFEEFDLENYPVPMLKRLLECKTFAYPVKCMPDLVMKFYGPIVCVSNYCLSSTDQALRNRFFDVYAGDLYWENEKVPWPVYEVKEEYEYDEVPAYPLWELLEGEEETDSDA